MRTTTILMNSAVATMIALLAAAGTALADHDGHGGGRDGGGGRNFSGDWGGGGGNQSFIRSGDGNRSFRSFDSDRSFSQTFRSDSGGRSVRLFDGRSSDSVRSGRSGTQQFEVRKPATGDQVRDFLNMRDGDSRQNVENRVRNRSPQNQALVDREFNQWQKTWNGEKDDFRDHRDWSGNWKNSDRFAVADRIRRDWDGRKDNDRIFGGDWWRHRHSGDWRGWWGDYAFRHNRPWYWWSWATGPRLGSWFVFGWPTPYYWDYGPGEYIYCDNGGIYVNGLWWQPAPVFYDQTVRIIDQAPDLNTEAASQLEWMPLGVFAATPDGVAEPEVLLQLAVTKDGVIGGTAFDQKSGAAYNIRGMVDKRSQRAVWSFTNDRNKRIMMETSIYNLTQPEATGMVHYSPTDMRVVELVRLEQPQSGAAAPGNASGNAPSNTLPPPTAQ